jgi:hypothetical protein
VDVGMVHSLDFDHSMMEVESFFDLDISMVVDPVDKIVEAEYYRTHYDRSFQVVVEENPVVDIDQ